MPETLRFSVTRTRDDHARAYRTFCWRGRVLKTVWLLLAAYVVFGALDLFSGLLNGEVSEWSQAQSTVSLTAILLILFCYSYFVAPVLATRSVPREGVPWNVMIDKNGITESSALEDIEAKWGMFSAALETKEDLLLVRGRVGFRFYPKQKLDRQTAGHLRELIRNNISEVKLRRTSHDDAEIARNDKAGNSESPLPTVSSTRFAGETETSEGLDFKCTLTKDDYKRAYRLFMRRSRLFRVLWGFMSVMFLYYISGDVVGLIHGDSILRVLISVFPLVFLFIIWILFVFYWYPALVARSAPDVGVAFDINIGDAGIVSISTNAGSRMGWGIFTRAIETADDFLLFRGGAYFNAYPKRMFAGLHEIETFRDLIRDNVPKARLLSG